MSHVQDLFSLSRTSFTKTTHKNVYPAIDPTKASLSQAGKTILITGGGSNLGLSIAKAFVLASATYVIITGRRNEVLQTARAQLEQDVKEANTSTKIIAISCDITDPTQVNGLWEELNGKLGLLVDVFVSNAARPPQTKTILEAGSADIWAQMEANVKGPLLMAEKLYAQPGQRQKFIVNVAVASVHYYTHPAAAARPGGTLSKSAGTTMFQLMAMETSHERLQVVTYHPGLLWNDYFKSLGLDKGDFDSRELAAAFAVWAATKEAAFLHGRFVWASWDVEELGSGSVREEIEGDPYFLRSSVFPLKGADRG